MKHARFYIACVALGLVHLHGKFIIYRDLKLENVVLDGRGYGKLCDFGTAKILRSQAQTHTLVGTTAYLAPEVLGQIGYSFGADWWSLGVFSYELIKGNLPFEGDHPKAILEATQVCLSKEGF